MNNEVLKELVRMNKLTIHLLQIREITVVKMSIIMKATREQIIIYSRKSMRPLEKYAVLWSPIITF